MHLLEDSEPRDVQYLEPFWDAFLLLEDSLETIVALVGLLDQAVIEGEAVPKLKSSMMRLIRTPVGACRRPLSLYFFVEDRTVKFMHIEHDDEDTP